MKHTRRGRGVDDDATLDIPLEYIDSREPCFRRLGVKRFAGLDDTLDTGANNP